MFVSAIANFVAPVAEEITQFSDQVKLILISQLINGVSKALQTFFNYFNSMSILTSFTLPTHYQQQRFLLFF